MSEVTPQTVLAGRYVLEEEIATGGMATIWRATDRVLDRPVAVKMLRADLSDSSESRERFNTEAVAAAGLAHRGIVGIFDTGMEDGVPYIVMELFDGEPLSDVLARDGSLQCERAIEIVLPVLSALEFAHENGVIHRDVKPANILVGPNGMVKITDFGIARAAYASSDVTTTGKVLGSVPYLSPEQVRGDDVDPRSDIYACGVVLYEMLTGRRPFVADTDLGAAMMRLDKDPLPPRAVRAGIPRAVDGAVMKAMARHPEDRFPTATSMAATLARLRTPPTTKLPPVRPTVRPQAQRGAGWFRSWMLVPLLAVVAAAIAIAVGLSLGDLQFGGPLGIQAKNNSESSAGQKAIPIIAAEAFDPPPGDGQEHDEEVPLAYDGDPATSWETENYNELDLAPKPGVGLLFDLGRSQAIGGFRLITPNPGFHFQIRVGDDPGALAGETGPEFTATPDMRETIDTVKGRYVLVWVTQVVPTGDGNRATIAEFRVFGG